MSNRFADSLLTYTIPVYTVKTPYDGHRNCPKHVKFYSKNKFEKLVHLFGFIIKNFHDARSPKRQTEIVSELFRGQCAGEVIWFKND